MAIWIDVKVLVYIKGNYKIKLLQLSILFIYNYTITLKEKNLNNTFKKYCYLKYASRNIPLKLNLVKKRLELKNIIRNKKMFYQNINQYKLKKIL